MMEQGRLLKGIGSFYEVLTDAGDRVTCKARGVFRLEKITPTVGDLVLIERQSSGYASLSQILPRKNLFVRPAVANIDQLFIVISASIPAPDWLLADRMIIQAITNHVVPIPVLNKIDTQSDSITEQFRKDYQAFTTCITSAQTGEGVEHLRQLLGRKTSCFAGQSAVGKSSLLNALFPDLCLETGALSKKTEHGRHTTRHAELWPIDGAAVLDTPGFSFYDTECPDQDTLNACYPEFEKASPCRYPDCKHLREPDCGVKALLDTGDLTEARYERYSIISREFEMRRKHRYD